MEYKVFAPGEVFKRYDKLKITEKGVELLDSYFDAFVNLYGAIPVKKALEIIKEQNPGIFTDGQLKQFVTIKSGEFHYYGFLYPQCEADCKRHDLIDCDIVAEMFFETGPEDAYHGLKVEQENKPFYIPPKEVLIKYADEEYYEPTNSSGRLKKYIEENVDFSGTDFTSSEIVDEYVGYIRAFPEFGECMEIISDYLNMPSVKIKGKNYEQFFTELTDLAASTFNDTRMWANCGHTPKELDSEVE